MTGLGRLPLGVARTETPWDCFEIVLSWVVIGFLRILFSLNLSLTLEWPVYNKGLPLLDNENVI